MNIVFALVSTYVPDPETDTWKAISAHSGKTCLSKQTLGRRQYIGRMMGDTINHVPWEGLRLSRAQ